MKFLKQLAQQFKLKEPVPPPAPVVVEPPKGYEVLTDGTVATGERSQTITVEGESFHHVSELPDGRWVYAGVRPRD